MKNLLFEETESTTSIVSRISVVFFTGGSDTYKVHNIWTLENTKLLHEYNIISQVYSLH